MGKPRDMQAFRSRETDSQVKPGRNRDGNWGAGAQPTETGGGPSGTDAGSADLTVQTKLEVSSPSDPAEKEADRVSADVLEMDEPVRGGDEPVTVSKTPKAGTDDGGQLDGQTEQRIEAVRSQRGESLPDSTRSYFEPRFGADFSDVEVHNGSTADQGAKSIDAEAFTVDTDMAFRSGSYQPDTSGGKELIGHELTHVVQQQGGTARMYRTVHRQAEAAGGQCSYDTYTVHKGDTLSEIALREGVEGGWPALHAANEAHPKNPVADPHHIEPGWELYIPRDVEGNQVCLPPEVAEPTEDGGGQVPSDAEAADGDAGYTGEEGAIDELDQDDPYTPSYKTVPAEEEGDVISEPGAQNWGDYAGDLYLPAQIAAVIPVLREIDACVLENPDGVGKDVEQKIIQANVNSGISNYNGPPVGLNLLIGNGEDPWEAVGRSLRVASPTWRADLPDPPCDLFELAQANGFEGERPDDVLDIGTRYLESLEDGDIFYNATGVQSSILHPSGALDFRSDSAKTDVDFHAQQVFYDGSLLDPGAPLITGGASAGTPDYACAKQEGEMHELIDVAPFYPDFIEGHWPAEVAKHNDTLRDEMFSMDDGMSSSTYLDYWGAQQGGCEEHEIDYDENFFASWRLSSLARSIVMGAGKKFGVVEPMGDWKERLANWGAIAHLRVEQFIHTIQNPERALEVLAGQTQEIWETIKNSDFGIKARDAWETASESISEWVVDSLGWIAENGRNTWDRVMDWGVFGFDIETLLDQVSGVVSGVDRLLDTFGHGLWQGLESAAEVAESALETLADAPATIWSGLAGGMNQAAEAISGLDETLEGEVLGALDRVTAGAMGLKSQIREAGIDIWAQAVDFAREAADLIPVAEPAWIDELIELGERGVEVVSSVAGIPEDIYNSGSEAVSTMSATIQRTATDGLDTAREFVDRTFENIWQTKDDVLDAMQYGMELLTDETRTILDEMADSIEELRILLD